MSFCCFSQCRGACFLSFNTGEALDAESEAAGREGAFFAGADLFLLMLVGSLKAAGARALNFN